MHFFGCVECQNYTLVATAETTIKQSRPRLGYANLNQQINSKPTNHIPTSCIWNSECTILQHIIVDFWENYCTHWWLWPLVTTTKQNRPRLGYTDLNHQQINSKPTNHIPTSCIWKLRMYNTATYNCWVWENVASDAPRDKRPAMQILGKLKASEEAYLNRGYL